VIEPRPYQAAGIEALRTSYRSGHRAPLYVLATGAGKTIVLACITRSAWSKGRRVLVVVHRRELVNEPRIS